MPRDPHSHKGENGKVAVIGGSRHIHGAPIFSSLAAEASGVDLIFTCVPPAHETVTTMHSLNFQVYTFKQDELGNADVGYILQMLAIMDCAVIGPGLTRNTESLEAIEKIISGSPCPLVLDAGALQPSTLELIEGKTAILTPHLGELERMGIAQDDIGKAAEKLGITILLKGHIDLVATADGSIHEVQGGNAGLTVGGTGDALAGLVAGLLAQRHSVVDACVLASTIIKGAGDALAAKRSNFTTQDVISMIPTLLDEKVRNDA